MVVTSCPLHAMASLTEGQVRRKPLVVILGPTAVGKSRVAIEIAKRLDSEILTADSRQVYRGMDVGTDKPLAAARIAELKRQMVQKENEISVLLGRNPAKISRGRALTEQLMPPLVPAGLPSELLMRRPDVIQAEQQLAAATARIGQAKADRFPKLSITGMLGIASPN